jgi:hypothetical protein
LVLAGWFLHNFEFFSMAPAAGVPNFVFGLGIPGFCSLSTQARRWFSFPYFMILANSLFYCGVVRIWLHISRPR